MSNIETLRGRKRQATSKLLESDEPLAKKLRGKKTAGEAVEQPEPLPAISQQPSRSSSRSSLPSTHSRSPSVHEEEDPDHHIEIRGPIPKRADRNVEAADESDDDEEDGDPRVAAVKGKDREDPQAKLDALYKTYKSPIYVFFLPPVYLAEYGKEFHVFECAAKDCKCTGGRLVKRNINTTNATSTSNLRSHANRCWGEDVVKAAMGMKSIHEAREVLKDKKNLRQSSIRVAFQMAGETQVTYSDRLPTNLETRVNHVKWVCGSNRPFAVVEDEGYHLNMKTGPGRQHTYIPSASTVSRDVKKVFLGAREKISWLLQNHKGRLHFATDCWTSPNRRAYMAVTVQFERGGVVEEFLLDIVEVAHRHTGVRLAMEFTKVLQEFGIVEKILSITCDNATNNDVMIEKMGELLDKFQGDPSRVRCFAHVINLVVKSIIAQFDLPKRKTNSADAHEKSKKRSAADMMDIEELDEDGYEVVVDDVAPDEDIDEVLAGGSASVKASLAKARKLAGNLDQQLQAQRNEEAPEDIINDQQDDGWVDERWDMSPAELEELAEEVMPARRMLIKLRKIAFAIKNSSTVVAPRWRAICTLLGMEERNMPTDVRTRWNSTHDMLKFAIKYEKAINMLTSERQLKLRNYDMEPEEWVLARHLDEVLVVFKEATLLFSEEETWHISSVLPAMDLLDQKLASAMVSTKYSDAIRSAVRIGKRTLNRYYSKTDHSEVYRIAVILDPRYKLSYFRKMKWTEEWIKAACETVEDAYGDYKDPDIEQVDQQDDDDDIMMVDNPQLNFTKEPKTTNTFKTHLAAAAPSTASQESHDELKQYLSTPPVSLEYKEGNIVKVMSPLQWWLKHRETYPRLSRMALDYLSIPPTSVDVERVFSTGRQVLSYLRNRLSVQTTRSIMCLQEWLSIGLLKDKEMNSWLQGLRDIDEEDEEDVADGWDHITRRYAKSK